MDKRRSSKRPTQVDVARLAGVSQTMVSYVLNGKPAIAVPPETKQRIQAAMDELGYVPHGPARSLRTQRTCTVAGIIPDIANPFYPAFARGIQDTAERWGYDLTLYNTDGCREKELKGLQNVRAGRADGAIIVPFHLTPEDFLPLLKVGVAVVVLGQAPATVGNHPLDSLSIDNVAAAHEAVSCLLTRGHTRIAMLAGLEETPPCRLRSQGYRQALEDAGLAVDPELIVAGEFTEKGGYLATRELLNCAMLPTAIFAANDLMAMGAYQALHEAGKRVPEDVAIVGFDDIPAARLVAPPLTTVTQYQERQGRRAAEMLVERLNDTAPPEGRHETMPFGLVLRAST